MLRTFLTEATNQSKAVWPKAWPDFDRPQRISSPLDSQMSPSIYSTHESTPPRFFYAEKKMFSWHSRFLRKFHFNRFNFDPHRLRIRESKFLITSSELESLTFCEKKINWDEMSSRDPKFVFFLLLTFQHFQKIENYQSVGIVLQVSMK